MFFAAGAVGAAAAAAGTALDLLSSLRSAKSGAAKTAGVKQSDSAFSLSGTSAGTPAPASSAPAGALSSSTFNALLTAQDAAQARGSGPSDALKSLFAQIDGNADGKITQAEFQDKLGAGGTNTQAADNVFAKMDADDDGSISLNEMAAALTKKQAAPAIPAANASSQYNIIDQMVQRQTDSLAVAAKQSVSLKV